MIHRKPIDGDARQAVRAHGLRTAVVATVAVFALAGCAGMTDTQRRTATGAGVDARGKQVVCPAAAQDPVDLRTGCRIGSHRLDVGLARGDDGQVAADSLQPTLDGVHVRVAVPGGQVQAVLSGRTTVAFSVCASARTYACVVRRTGTRMA